jgi:hypothetical protein
MIGFILASPGNGVEAAPSIGEILIDDVRWDSFSWFGYPAPIPTKMTFCLGYDFNSFQSFPPVDTGIGCVSGYNTGQTGSEEFNDPNSPNFDAVIARLTDENDELLYLCAHGMDDDNSPIRIGTCGANRESVWFGDALAAFKALSSSIDHLTLNVDSVDIRVEDYYVKLDWDVTWEFWSEDVLLGSNVPGSTSDSFLLFAQPLQRLSRLPSGTTSYTIVLRYGAELNPQSFHAEVNSEPIGGFHPIPGTWQAVDIPLASGQNELYLEVQGTLPDGKTRTDKDHFIFIVPK